MAVRADIPPKSAVSKLISAKTQLAETSAFRRRRWYWADCDRYGLEHRTPMNQTPLMAIDGEHITNIQRHYADPVLAPYCRPVTPITRTF
jgi:hypothetical protein